MTVTQKQQDILKAKGFNFIPEICKAADDGNIHLYILVAMLEKETGTVRNVYGNDRGGALAGFKKTVNQGNFEVFEWMITTKGMVSNGVGPSQLTFKGFFSAMKDKGLKPWEPADNIAYGGKLIYGYYRHARNNGHSVSDSLKIAGTKYNGAAAYGASYLEVATKWRGLLGNEDYRHVTEDEIEHRLGAIELQLAAHRADWLALHDQMVSLLGKSAGLRAGWLYLLGFVAAMGTLISIFHIMAT